MEELIGEEVVVYCRYLFAVPVTGRIVNISKKDGAYQIMFDDNNPGGHNVLKHNGRYFHKEQCKFISEAKCDLDTVYKKLEDYLECFVIEKINDMRNGGCCEDAVNTQNSFTEFKRSLEEVLYAHKIETL